MINTINNDNNIDKLLAPPPLALLPLHLLALLGETSVRAGQLLQRARW